MQEKLKEPGMPSAKDFAALMAMSVRTLYNVFNQSSDLTFPQVVKASEILKYDLIGHYLKADDKLWILHETEGAYRKKKKTLTISLQLQVAFDDVAMLPDVLKDLNDVAQKRGFTILK
ncbi:hypothetical protein [Mucilaginibacter sp.]|uniref:hypothetical protein n=1 Tax=Mucilaginibacter sp. TaxID=1882438 RepID=UPI00262DE064|nr:hypothetical protein [Mucilaginibacter sp.]